MYHKLNHSVEKVQIEIGLKEIKIFYKNLFSKKVLNNSDTHSFLDSLNLPKISDSEKVLCESEIKLGDLKEAVLSMSDDKSPGNDGITREYYNTPRFNFFN